VTDPLPAPLLTVESLAALLGLSPRGARRVLERGELPGFRLGRRWFVRPQDLEDALAGKVAAQERDREGTRDAALRILRGLPAARKPAGRAEESP